MDNRKLLLADVRKGDYAHPGEEEAIMLALGSVPNNGHQCVLDVGCGLGGTANYLDQQGFGEIIGIDHDPVVIKYAKEHYPHIYFECCDVIDVKAVFEPESFDLIYSFSAFFSFASQEDCLKALASVSKKNGELILFDYMSPSAYMKENIFLDTVGVQPKLFIPIDLSKIEKMLLRTGWQLKRILDLTNKYDAWYQWLIAEMLKNKTDLTHKFGVPTFNDLYEGYSKLLELIHRKEVGGGVVYARRKKAL